MSSLNRDCVPAGISDGIHKPPTLPSGACNQYKQWEGRDREKANEMVEEKQKMQICKCSLGHKRNMHFMHVTFASVKWEHTEACDKDTLQPPSPCPQCKGPDDQGTALADPVPSAMMHMINSCVDGINHDSGPGCRGPPWLSGRLFSQKINLLPLPERCLFAKKNAQGAPGEPVLLGEKAP